MMRSFRASMAGVGCGAIAVLALAVIAANGASASVLVLKANGVPLKKGGAATEALSLSGACFQEAAVKVTANEKGADKLAFKSSTFEGCQLQEFAMTGHVKTVTLTSKGKATFKASPKVAYTVTGSPGPCVYEFSKFEGTFQIPGVTIVNGEVTGKLKKKGSDSLCEKAKTITFLRVRRDGGTRSPGNGTQGLGDVPRHARRGQ